MSTTFQPVHYPSMRGHRFHLLDGLRGVSAILIVLHHTPSRPHLPLPRAWLAVDFFFLLSGFVIAFSYEARLLNGMRLRDFVAARLIRLYPLYLAGTILGLFSIILVDTFSAHVTLSLSDLVLSLPAALLLIPNFFNHWPQPYCFPFDFPAWSLFLEVVANILFAWLLRTRLANTAGVIFLIATSLCILLAASHYGGSTLNLGAFLSSLPFSLIRVVFSFFAGVLIFRVYRSQSFLFPMALRTWVFPIAASVGLAGVLVASSAFTATLTYQIVVVTILFPGLLFLGAHSQLPALVNRACAFLGDISYPLYILHAPLVSPLAGSRFQHLLELYPAGASWFLPVVFAFLILLAWFAARYPDRAVRLWLTHRYNTANL